MICYGCGNDNPPTAQFCGYCGQSMATVADAGLSPPAYAPPPPAAPAVPVMAPPEAPYVANYANLEPATVPLPGFNQPAAPPFKDRLALSVALCILNFVTGNLLGLAAGIGAAVFSSKVRNQAKIGDLSAAEASQRTARTFVWISLALFILGLISLTAFGVWFFSNYRIEF